MKKTLLFLILVLTASGAAALSFGDFFTDIDQRGEAALIQFSGPVNPTAGTFSTGITPGEVRELNSLAEEQGADAIIYEINSGGGAVVASKEVKRIINSTQIPSVCRIRDVGASGAYLYSLGCDSIVADSASITGSIGVTSSYLEFSDLMEEIGVSYVNITAGKRKEIGSQFEEPTEQEKQILEGKASMIGDEFLQEVSEARNLTDSQEEEVGTGEIFLGSEAKELGLVDELGGRRTAVEEAEDLTGKDLKVSKVERTPEFSLFDLFVPGLELGSEGLLQASL
ncbi:MAG: S49 family peptidase [Candidatus Nanohaloarchaea archaeon]